MCGVSGTFSLNGGMDRGVAAAMHSRLLHRGPDETYSLNTDTISVKLARLGFTGLSDGWQPAEDRSGRFVAMTNGEVFNSPSLRDKVGADRQSNAVDVSVIPQLVAQYGIEGLRLVDGQFATAVYDRAEKTVYLARDRFGICPMYYAETGPDVHFCSEIKPLVQCVDRPWKVDIGAVDQYFSLGNIVAPRTLVRGIRSVPPGSAIRFDANGTETLRYWRYGEFSPSTGSVSDEELREALKSSVRDRLRADVEIGAYLSGGFDSTAILMTAATLTDQPVHAFSVIFDDPGLDEGRFQREVAQAVGSKHEQILCRRSDISSKFEEMVRHCCYPQRETYNVAAMMLSASVRDAGIKGVVSGEGADELFFGYDSYAFDSAARSRRRARAENEQAWGRADFSWEVDWVKASRRRDEFLAPVAQEALRGDEFWRTRLIPFTEDEVRSLSAMQLRSIADVYVQMSGHLLGDHGDSMVMVNSVEGRYPFLGNTVVSLALLIQDDAKVVDFEGKSCLKSAYSDIVPESVLRRGKHGFTAYDLRSAVDARTWDDWYGLVEASGIFTPGCLDEPTGQGGADKWDFRLSAISIALLMDELGLAL